MPTNEYLDLFLMLYILADYWNCDGVFCCYHQASTARHLYTSLVQQLAILLLCDQSLTVREEDIYINITLIFCIQLARKERS